MVGRANVADTPDLLAYYKRLETLGTGALWTVANKIEPWEPASTSVPMLWRYRDLREDVLRALDLVTPEQAGRRVVYLENKGRADVVAAVGWLYSGLQVMAPGECASSHRHSASALRFIMEGQGAFTNVDGHKMTLGANDFVLTPNGTWHEHGVAEDGTVCIWQDGLDIPLMNALEANFYEVHPDLQQAISFAVDDSTATWAGAGLRPAGAQWTKRYSPLLKYEWAPTYEALTRYARVTDGSPYDGILMDYVNPDNGGPVMQTIGASMQLLRPGERTKAHRQTGSFVYQCAKGSGWSIINGQRFDWRERDIFVVPAWMYHEHGNASDSEDACLFSFHDLPVMRALGLYREEALGENDGHQPILS
ncbi:NADPH dehydrogenase [Novosphingobium barchaimii]|nr:NADPH dehydrogenase [Novosphingobium barchaimii]